MSVYIHFGGSGDILGIFPRLEHGFRSQWSHTTSDSPKHQSREWTATMWRIHEVRLHSRRGEGVAKPFSRERKEAPQKEDGGGGSLKTRLLCSPFSTVTPADTPKRTKIHGLLSRIDVMTTHEQTPQRASCEYRKALSAKGIPSAHTKVEKKDPKKPRHWNNIYSASQPGFEFRRGT